MESLEWFYVDMDGESKGPITTREVKKLPLHLFVWNETMQEWTELSELQSMLNPMHEEGNVHPPPNQPNQSNLPVPDQNDAANLMTLAALAQLNDLNHSERIIDEEIDEPMDESLPDPELINMHIVNPNHTNINHLDPSLAPPPAPKQDTAPSLPATNQLQQPGQAQKANTTQPKKHNLTMDISDTVNAVSIIEKNISTQPPGNMGHHHMHPNHVRIQSTNNSNIHINMYNNNNNNTNIPTAVNVHKPMRNPQPQRFSPTHSNNNHPQNFRHQQPQQYHSPQNSNNNNNINFRHFHQSNHRTGPMINRNHRSKHNRFNSNPPAMPGNHGNQIMFDPHKPFTNPPQKHNPSQQPKHVQTRQHKKSLSTTSTDYPFVLSAAIFHPQSIHEGPPPQPQLANIPNSTQITITNMNGMESGSGSKHSSSIKGTSDERISIQSIHSDLTDEDIAKIECMPTLPPSVEPPIQIIEEQQSLPSGSDIHSEGSINRRIQHIPKQNKRKKPNAPARQSPPVMSPIPLKQEKSGSVEIPQSHTETAEVTVNACPLCTFHNDLSARRCSMCYTELIPPHKDKQKTDAVKANSKKNAKSMKSKAAKSKNEAKKKRDSDLPLTERQRSNGLMHRRQFEMSPKSQPEGGANRSKEGHKQSKEEILLNAKMEELMKHLQIPDHAKPNMLNLPKEKKLQMIEEYEKQKQMKESPLLKSAKSASSVIKPKKKQKGGLFGKKKKNDMESGNEQKSSPVPFLRKKRSKQMSTELDLQHFRIDPLPDGTKKVDREAQREQNVNGQANIHNVPEEQEVVITMKSKRYPSPLPAPQPRQNEKTAPKKIVVQAQTQPNNALFDQELQRKIAEQQKQSKMKTYANRQNGKVRVEVQVEQKQQEAKKKDTTNENAKQEELQSNISILEAYVDKYGKQPQNASHLMQFSKIDPRFKPLSFMQARKQLSNNKGKNENEEKKTDKVANKKQAKKPQNNQRNGWSKAPKKAVKQDQFVPPPPANVPATNNKGNATKNVKPKIEKANGHGIQNGKNRGNEKKKKKVASIWDVNENEGDDPMGATYKKTEILNAYHHSAIVEQTAESMAKQQMGIISPMTQRMRSVFDESSSDEEDEGDKQKQQQDDRLTINVRNAKHAHNVSAHFKMKL